MRSFSTALTLGALLAGMLAPCLAHATETITYSYDHRGRLVQVVHTGTVNNGLTVTYTYDKMGNRTQVVTVGASH